MLTPTELIIMATLCCDAAQAHAEYAAIEAILINLGAPAFPQLGKVQGDTVNVRAKPGTSAAIVGKLRLGDEVEVWGSTPAGDWYCVDGEPPGWVSAKWVTV